MKDKEPISDLEFMRHPNLWPNMVCPMKRNTYPHPLNKPKERMGILWTPLNEDEGKKYYWYPGQYCWGPIPKDAECIVGGDELLVKLIKEGWVVD